MNDFWLKQSGDKPLFEDILWMKPENPHQRPKVLIVGGSSHGFMTTTQLYSAIKSKSAYQTKVALPKSIDKMLGNSFEDAVFVSSTKSGEIASEAKNDLSQMIDWAQVVVISDDIGNNSQTELLLQELLLKTDTPVFVLGHSIDLIAKSGQDLANKDNLVLVGVLSQISHFAAHTGTALQNSDGLLQLVDKLNKQSDQRSYSIATYHEGNIIVSSDKISTTKAPEDPEGILRFIAESVQFGKNFEAKRFETLTTGAYLAVS